MPKIKYVLGAASAGCLAAMTLLPSATASDAPGGSDATAKRSQVLGGAPCGSDKPGDWDSDVEVRTFETASMRTGSGPSCAVRDRVGRNVALNPYCYVFAPSNDHYWVAAKKRDASTWGWIRRDHFVDGGSNDDCPEFIARPAFLR